jgi:hypothetical protein
VTSWCKVQRDPDLSSGRAKPRIILWWARWPLHLDQVDKRLA